MKYAAHPWRQDLPISIRHRPVLLSRGCGSVWERGTWGVWGAWTSESEGCRRHQESGDIKMQTTARVGIEFWKCLWENFGINLERRGDFLWAREAAPSSLEAVPFTCFIGERGGGWRNSWIRYWFLLPTEMTATSKIWIIARKGKKKKKSKNRSIPISIYINLFFFFF